MGLFHKTLKDAKKAANEGNLGLVKEILQDHIAAEHSFNSDLAGLQGAIASYQHDLRIILKGFDATVVAGKKDHLVVSQQIEQAEDNFMMARALIRKLQKDARFN